MIIVIIMIITDYIVIHYSIIIGIWGFEGYLSSTYLSRTGEEGQTAKTICVGYTSVCKSPPSKCISID
jgi:hypothetical protein